MWWEWLLILGIGVFFVVCFRLQSPVNGPHEIFEQDSTYILGSLSDGQPYPYNPQDHLLYHVAVNAGYALIQPWVGASRLAVYRYLKVVTAMTGVAFLLVLRRLLQELDVRASIRAALLLLASVSVSGWFNFSAFETHSLPLAAFAVVLLVLFRLARRSVFGIREAAWLCGALTFAMLCRIEYWGLLALVGLFAFSPAVRPHARRLAGALGTAAVAGIAGMLTLACVYLHVPLREAPARLSARHDRGDLVILGTANLQPEPVLQMVRAATLYAFVMPVGPATFRTPLRRTARAPLAAAALVSLLVVLGYTGAHLVRRLAARDLFLWWVTAIWVASLAFYTWFDPQEPFLWLLEFLPPTLVCMGDAFKSGGRVATALLFCTDVLVLASNAVFFWAHYR